MVNPKKESEFGGKGTHKTGILKGKPRRALSAEEKRRLLVNTGTENPEATPDPAWFTAGRRPK